jgi:hypothetical protein
MVFRTALEAPLTGFEKFKKWYKPDRFIHWGYVILHHHHQEFLRESEHEVVAELI